MKIEIDPDTVDGLILAALKDAGRRIRKFPSKHAEDIEYDKRLIEALKIVIQHYGG